MQQELELVCFLNRFEKIYDDGNSSRGYIGANDHEKYFINFYNKNGKETITLKRRPLTAQEKEANEKYKKKKAASNMPKGETLSV